MTTHPSAPFLLNAERGDVFSLKASKSHSIEGIGRPGSLCVFLSGSEGHLHILSYRYGPDGLPGRGAPAPLNLTSDIPWDCFGPPATLTPYEAAVAWYVRRAHLLPEDERKPLAQELALAMMSFPCFLQDPWGYTLTVHAEESWRLRFLRDRQRPDGFLLNEDSLRPTDVSAWRTEVSLLCAQPPAPTPFGLTSPYLDAATYCDGPALVSIR